MKPLRILHITPWFPNPENAFAGIFIAAHLKALSAFCTNEILHVQFKSKSAINKSTYEGMNLVRIDAKPVLNKWRIKELMATQIIYRFLKKNAGRYDIVNFYIAYPNAIQIGRLKQKFPQLTFTLSDQWSAYHQNFGLPKGHKGLQRIAQIFKHNTPQFVVSKALGNDIRNFTDQPQLSFEVIPNIADLTHFHFKEKTPSDSFHFCSINSWSPMKNPIVLMEAFARLVKEYPNVRLTLGGSGKLLEQMQQKVKALQLNETITLTGRLTKDQVAELLFNANVYCQSSNYETFSAICIEALATGTPVIATNIGGMKDFVSATNGALVDEMTPEAWYTTMKNVMLNYSQYNHQEIAQHIAKNYNADKIGSLYYNHFKQLIASNGK